MNTIFAKSAAAILLCVLGNSTFAAEANWTKFWTDDTGTVSYFDKNTPIMGLTDGFAVRIMNNLKKPLSLPSMNAKAFSTTALLVINCNNKTHTLTKVSAFAGPHATGKAIIIDVDEHGAFNIEPNTSFYLWYSKGCSH